MRNVIVHSAGIADVMFRRQIRPDGLLAQCELGKQIQLDGIVVTQFVETVMAKAIALIMLVDQSLSPPGDSSTQPSTPST